MHHITLLIIPSLAISSHGPLIDTDSDRGQGLNYAITDAAELLQQLRSMTEHTSEELAAAVKRYEADLFIRGREGVITSNENTNAVHDWATIMDSPLFKDGMQREISIQST